MRRKNLLKELGIQKQADTSCNALDIDTCLLYTSPSPRDA